MKDLRYFNGIKVTPLLITEGAVGDESTFVKVTGNWLSLSVAIGDVDTAITVQVEASSANSTNASSKIVAISHFNLSGTADTATASDTWAGWSDTANDTTGVITLAATTDSKKLLWLEIDPRTLPEGLNYVHVVTSATSYNSPTPAMAIVAYQEARYMAEEYST